MTFGGDCGDDGVVITVASVGGCRMFASNVLNEPMQPLVMAMKAESTAGSAYDL